MLLRLSVGAAFAYCAYAMCRAPVLPLYAQSLGAGPELIGVVAAASTVTGILLKLPAGALSDAVGRRMVLLSATSVFALLPFAYPWIAGVTSLVLLRAVHGAATALLDPLRLPPSRTSPRHLGEDAGWALIRPFRAADSRWDRCSAGSCSNARAFRRRSSRPA